MDKNCASDSNTKIFKFSTQGFVYFEGQIFDLYRGNILVKEEQVSIDSLTCSIELARDWFLANNDKNNIFNYEYLPETDSFSAKDSQIRQFGGLGAASRTAHFLDDKELEKKCLEKAKHYSSLLQKEGNTAWFYEGEKSKLGTSALFLIALLELNKENQFDAEIEQLGNFILSMQMENGAFYTHYPKSIRESSVNYYPGEALLALMLAFEETGKKEYLKAVEKAFPYYKKYFDENKNTSFIPWQSSAYSHAFLTTGKKEYAEFVFEMTDWILKLQYDENAPYPDYKGGFSLNGTPGSSTCSYSEGLGDALLTAKTIKDTDRTEKYRNALKNALRLALQLQFNEKNTYSAKKPELTTGGFRNSLATEKIRVDNVQHCTTAILKFIEIETD